MKIERPSHWPTDLQEATALQKQLSQQVVTRDDFGELKIVAGVDVGFEQGGDVTRAAVALLSYPDLQPLEQVIARRPTSFPYIPGFLSFREIPTVLDALEQLQTQPDMLLCDGHGIAHPRRLGIASHLGVLLDMPTIGVGKSILVGRHEELAQERGQWQSLIHKKEVIGAALRTRTGYKPLYISPGHRVSLETTIQIVMQCAPKYRLPETTRRAHSLASAKGLG
jgi:deoxyribonuclease V